MASGVVSEVIVIGGGPAGIAAAVALGERGVRAMVLERGDRAFAALRRVDPQMRLVSPTRLSRLPGMRELDGAARYLTMGEWIARAEQYRKRHGIEVETGVRVRAVRRDGELLVVETERGERAARHVIDATGQISWPQRPDGKGVHSLDVREPDLARSRRLMIVGGGTSAAETLSMWLRARAPGAKAWLVRRSARLVTPRRPFGVDIHYWVWPFEHVPLPAGRRPPHPLTFGGVLLTARLRPSVYTIAAPEEMPVRPDLIVHATGYRHAAPHLGDLVERHPDGEPRVAAARSTITPNLWVLGVPGARTAASAFLRGIAADAEHVARRIAP